MRICSLMLIISITWSCNAGTPTTVPGPVTVCTTDMSDLVLLKITDSLTWKASGARTREDSLVIEVDTSRTYQQINGFGAALTGSAAYVLHNYVNPLSRDSLFRQLFTPAGIGLDFLRVSIGPSDFSPHNFAYPFQLFPDSTLTLNLAEDTLHVLPILREILSINPALKIIASPWSAPASFKSNKQLEGGSLLPAYESLYARYLTGYLQAMQRAGIRIYALTPVSAPLAGEQAYPSMSLGAVQARRLVKNFLGPYLKASGSDARLMVYDGNLDGAEYADSLLDEKTVSQYVSGVAFHGYAGSVSNMSLVKKLHPEMEVVLTEISGGESTPVFGDNLRLYVRHMLIGGMRNWASGILFYNLALNEHHGPQNNGCKDCRGVITVYSKTGQTIRTEEYFALGHFGKFVRPGAYRVFSTEMPAHQIYNVAFYREGQYTVVVMNEARHAQRVSVVSEAHIFSYTLPSEAVVTFSWKSGAGK
ncbi:glycoside hydrolase family 30 protein [Chitinophaga defluvii]|uniref:Glycoside hydrolase family 30 beta sandwich domain-containing protein n=1 Tax=Chitinophaga defluvii TaxID=3163343 RepID=A0ABV2T517_9BACT